MTDEYTAPPQSRNEAILAATLDGTEYTAPPQSRIEDLLLQLKAAIEDGGGGGTVTSYTALTNKPQINGVTLTGNKSLSDLGAAASANLATVATSGAYDDLTGTPNLATVATSGRYADLSGKPNLSAVATSGAYSDLTGKPTIDGTLSGTSTNAVQNKAVYDGLAEKQDTLTFDATPTSGSSNPVTSGGVYTDQQRQETEIGVVAALGAKNLFNTSATDDTRDTVTFAVNGDGTINITTSAATTSSSNAYVIGTYIPEKTGQYTVSTGLSSAATGGSTSTTFCLQLRQGTLSSGTLIARIGSDPATLTLTAGETYTLRFYFLSGQTINEICKPMIRRAEITDDTYVPYGMTNAELSKSFVLTDMPVSQYVENLSGYNSGYYKDNNGVVHINAVFKAASNISGGTVITTLPTGYRPTKNVIMYGINVATREMISIDMNTNGQCAVYGTISSGNNICFSGSYPITDAAVAVASTLSLDRQALKLDVEPEEEAQNE